MRSMRSKYVVLSAVAALAVFGACASAFAADGDAASRLGGLAMPGAVAEKAAVDASTDAARPAEEASPVADGAASRLGGLAKPAASSGSADGSASSGSSLGGLAAPGKSGGLVAPSSSGSSLGGLAAPGASDAPASPAWSAADGDWTYDLDCLACHEKESTSFDNDKCLAKKHAALECKMCHSDEAGLVKAHGAVDAKSAAPSALVSTKVDVEATCQLCHDKEALIEATADSAVLTDDNGTVVNPHDLPVNDAHTADGTTCISCHKMHSSTALEKTAQRYCKGCHHAGVYECNTCHAA